MVYVALLRGINVGGHRKVAMPELRTVFEDAGMTSVRTYINSGNVIFSTSARSKERIAERLQKVIAKHFGFDVDVLVRDAKSMRAVVKALPDGSSGLRSDVLFLWSDVARPSVVAKLPFKPDIEDVRYVSGAIIRSIDPKDAAKSGMLKLVGTPLYKRMTIRNANTTRKLLELMEL